MEVQSKSQCSKIPEFIIQNIPFGILVEDTTRRVSMINSQFKKMFDLDIADDDLIGLDCRLLLNSLGALFIHNRSFLDKIDGMVSESTPGDNIVFRLVNGNYLSLSYLPIVYNEEKSGHCWCFKDITDRVKFGSELQKQKEFYENVLNSIPADIAVFNQDQYIFLNSSAISKEEIRDLIGWKNRVAFNGLNKHSLALAAMRHKYFQLALSNKYDVEWEEEYLKADGVVRTMLRKFHPHYRSGELDFIVGYGVDITHVKNQAKKIEVEEFRSKTLLNQLKEIVITIDGSGFLESINPAWEKITGYSVSSCLTKNFEDFLGEEDIKTLFRSNLTKGGASNLIDRPFSVRNVSGEIYWLEGYSSVLKDEQGDFIGYCCTFSDITARKKADEELLSLIKKERELNELKSQFVNMVSHEIRTPLAGILSSVELLEIIHQNSDAPIKMRSYKHFSSIKDQVIRLGSLMDNVLLLGKIEAGKVQLNLQEINLVRECNNLIGIDFNSKDLKILFSVKGKPFKVLVDWNLMKHVFTNLISNAIKYSEGKKLPELTLHFMQDTIRVQVKDYGIGIPEIELSKLFTSFTRASNVGNIEGTGLGLMLSKHFIQMHGGAIDVKSAEGEGTEFTVILPVILDNNS